MEWQNAFPEPIADEALASVNDRDELQAYIDAINAAGAERAAAEVETPGTLSEDDLTELEAYHASRASAEARQVKIDEDQAARAARLASVSFRPATAPPPATTPPAVTTSTTADDIEGFTPGRGMNPHVVLAVPFNGKAPGDTITLAEQGMALVERAKALKGAKSGERFTVARMEGYIDSGLTIPEDGHEMFKFLVNDHYDDEAIIAGFCAPPTTEYGFCGGSSAARPVLNSMRRYIAPRGRVTKVITPLLSDVGTSDGQIDDTGIDFWTNDDDDADPFVEKTCSVITCVDTESFELYSTYKCYTVKNFLALAYPEWVAFSAMQLDALWARKAERKLLDLMRIRAGGPIIGEQIYGAWVSFFRNLELLMNNYVENERYDDAGLVAWAPRYLRNKLRSDAILAGKNPPSDADINRAANDIGISRITWTMDQPTLYGDYPRQAKNDTLVEYPTDAWVLLSKSDNLRVMDFGSKNIGVTTEREYRDTASNLRNDYQVFVETFEGIIDNGCPVWEFQMPLCDNGLVAPTSGFDERTCVDDDVLS